MPQYDWNNYLWPQPATFINPITPPKIGQGAFGIPQGGAGSRPALTPLAQSFANIGFGGLSINPNPNVPLSGNIPTFQTAGGVAGEGGTFQQYGGTTPVAGRPTRQYRKPIGPQQPLSAGTQTAPLAPEDVMPQYSGFVSPNVVGGFEKDVFGNYKINEATGGKVPTMPQAFVTNPETGQPEYFYTANGDPIASTMTMYQQQQANLSDEDMRASGYTQFGGTWVYNPVGGGVAQQQQNNLPWWQQGQTWAGGQSFSSEKKANQAYAEQKRRERDAAKKKNPNRPNWNKKKGESGGGVTTATSFMGTG